MNISAYRGLLVATATAYIVACVSAYLNLTHFQGEYFPEGNYLIIGVSILSSFLCHTISKPPFFITIAFVATAIALGMASGVAVNSEVNSALPLASYQPSIYWHSLLIGLVLSSAGVLVGVLFLLSRKMVSSVRHT